MDSIRVQNKTFVKYIDNNQIEKAVANLAQRINEDYQGKEVVFLVILNGAFMFAADLLKCINIESKVSFVKLSSYNGMQSEGQVRQLIGLNEDLKDCNVIIIEDIVDSGKSMTNVLSLLKEKEVASVDICSLIFKPKAFKGNFVVKYFGFEITNEFIVGYGLDLDGYARTLKDIYQLKE